jgi:hypothetical protein
VYKFRIKSIGEINKNMWLKKNSGYIKFLRRQEKNEKIKKRAELDAFVKIVQEVIADNINTDAKETK